MFSYVLLCVLHYIVSLQADYLGQGLSLRQPFGGVPCPSEFAVIADVITDTINDLLDWKNWDHDKVNSEIADKVLVENTLVVRSLSNR